MLRAVPWYLKVKDALMLIVRKRKKLSSDHVTTRSRNQEVSVELDTFRTTLGGQLLTVAGRKVGYLLHPETNHSQLK